MNRFLLVLLLIYLFPSLAIAQYDDDEDDLIGLYDEEELISIATGTEKQVRFAPSVASVITAEDIRKHGATTIDEVLEMVPGIHVSLSTTNALNSVFSIRGIHTSQNPQVLYLVDGVPFRQVFNGSRPGRYMLPVENIKRVEVIRGPGSAVYGADAFSGVINVISKGASDLAGVRIGLRNGSFGREDYWLQYGTELDSGLELSSSIEYSKSDGDHDRIISSDLQSILLDPGFGTNASNAPGYLRMDYELLNARVGLEGDNFKLSLMTWQQFNAGWGDGIIQALDTEGSAKSEYYQLYFGYNGEFSESWRFETKTALSYYDAQNEYYLLPAGATVPILDGNIIGDPVAAAGFATFVDGVKGNPGGKEQKYSFEFISYFDGFSGHKFRFSAGYEYQDLNTNESKNFGPGVILNSDFPPGPPPANFITLTGELTDVSDTSNVYVPDSDRDIMFLTVQDEWTIANDWVLTAGLRVDDYSDFGSTTNPRLALVWATSYNFTSKFLYGRAFRAPSFLERLSANNPALQGNPDIDPEVIDTIEVAFDYRPTAASSAKVNFFRYWIEDLIEFVPMPSLGTGVKQATNATDQNGYGFEIELGWSLTDRIELSANYSWQQSENDDSDTNVVDAPGSQLYFSANWEPFGSNDVSVNADVNRILGRKRDVSDTRAGVGDYTIVNLSVIKKDLVPDFDIAFIVKNLFDEDAREPSLFDSTQGLSPVPDDYLLDGRAVLVELRYHANN